MRMETVEHGLIWRRPKYVPSWQPEKSGDLEHHVDPDETQPCLRVHPGKSVLDQYVFMYSELLRVICEIGTPTVQHCFNHSYTSLSRSASFCSCIVLRLAIPSLDSLLL